MAPGKNKLTSVGLKNAAGATVQDGGGLMLIKSGEGGRWICRYSIGGRRRDMGLGTYPDISLAAARPERDKWQSVLTSGVGPIEERKRREEEALKAIDPLGPTLAERVQTVFESRKASLRGDGQRGRWLSPLTLHVLPKLGTKKVAKIHQTDIRDVLAPIWKNKHATAEKAAQRLRIVFKAGKLAGFECDPFTVEAACYLLGESNLMSAVTLNLSGIRPGLALAAQRALTPHVRFQAHRLRQLQRRRQQSLSSPL